MRTFQISGKRPLQIFVHSTPSTVDSSSLPPAPSASTLPPPPPGSHGDGIQEKMAVSGEEEGNEAELAEVNLSVECVGFSAPDFRWIASGGMDCTLKIWDLVTGGCRHVCRWDEGWSLQTCLVRDW